MAIDRTFLRIANIFPGVKIVLEKFFNKYDSIAEAGLFKQGAPVAKTVSVTLTAAEILPPTGGLITGNQAAAGAAAYTLPLGSDLEIALVAANPDLAVGDAFYLTIVNLSAVAAEVITLTTNTGWTLAGDMTLAAVAAGDQSSGTFLVRRTGAGTFTAHRI